MLERIGVALGIVVLCAFAILRSTVPPRPVPATAPDTVFSAERAMGQVEQIAQRPHAVGTPDHERVRDYIRGRLSALGLDPQLQTTTAIGTRYQEAGRVQNILARIPGSEPGSKAVLIMAHYDGVEAGPAAADDGAGAAAILETLRALRARKQPLRHDVIALFTDGEESGLLGAAAFVREHPWAKDVAVVLNFEARGTTGRSLMFETGPGNLDVARALRSDREASAGSVTAIIYRALPNDTDLSELALLGLPALNFAFADGVERYHTTQDDVAHLNPGSLQHHGTQMLTMVRKFGNEPLPRARTGDGVFFDFPIIGLVVYPLTWELPLALVALVLVGIVVFRVRRGVIVGVLASLVALALSGVVGWLIGGRLEGAAMWSGLYAVALVLLALAVTAACRALALRWSTPRAMHAGALIVWLILALGLSTRVPGTGYLFTWPLLFAAAAALLDRGRVVAEWLAVAVTLIMLAGFTYGTSVVLLGISTPGAIVLCLLTSLIALLLAPTLGTIMDSARWRSAAVLALASGACFAIAAVTVHPSAAHPVRTALVYAENADSSDAWLGSPGSPTDGWTRSVIGGDSSVHSPAWTTRLFGYAIPFAGRKVQRVTLGAPDAALIGDTTTNGARRVVLRVTAPAGTTGLLMRASGAHVLTTWIDGRLVDTTRYRSAGRGPDRSGDWIMQYWAVPDTGAIISLAVPAQTHLTFELAARRDNVPPIPGVTIPPRPADVVPSQTGDVSVVYRVRRF
jgi:hypothetical protein